MGMFDEINIICPYCEKTNELQSKAGKCDLKIYSIDDLPMAIGEDLLGFHRCYHCDDSFEIRRSLVPRYEVLKR